MTSARFKLINAQLTTNDIYIFFKKKALYCPYLEDLFEIQILFE